MNSTNNIVYIQVIKSETGGWGGIRTLETLARLPVFKTGAFNHSATHPSLISSGLVRAGSHSWHPIGTGASPLLLARQSRIHNALAALSCWPGSRWA